MRKVNITLKDFIVTGGEVVIENGETNVYSFEPMTFTNVSEEVAKSKCIKELKKLNGRRKNYIIIDVKEEKHKYTATLEDYLSVAIPND